ncbi:MAG TPA: hypothetical protein VFK32_09120 [Tepidiformaceae bacterium]|nr:hypothetical protein [Tepidiformaceae bacterium]
MVRILILGRSSVSGLGVEREESWPEVLRVELERELGTPIELHTRTFRPDGRDPTQYLERLVKEIEPDVINVSVAIYDFAAARVENRIQERFGRRIAQAAYKVEKFTTDPHRSGNLGRVNRWSRRLAHRFVGAAPRMAREQVEYTLDNAFRFLARQEQIAVVVRHSSTASKVLLQANPAYNGMLESFNAEWKARALKHHFYWAEGEPYAEDEYMRDGLHTTPAGHRRRATVMAPYFVRAIRERVLQPEAAGR